MSNGHLPNQWFDGGEEAEMANNVNDEKQTVLYLKRNGDGQAGIETILKRELQGLYIIKKSLFELAYYLIRLSVCLFFAFKVCSFCSINYNLCLNC